MLCNIMFFFMYAMHILQNDFLQLIARKEEMPAAEYTSVIYSCQVHSRLSLTDLIIPHFMVE